MLFIDEEESVRRQLLRGQRSIAHNAEVEASGVGDKREVRKTDLDEDAAHLRYKTFKESTYDSLTTLRQLFHYHFINAHGTVIEVQQRIIQELKYQSSLELDEATYDRISSIPLADKLSLHARQLLVHRLDSYEKFHSELFDRVVRLVKSKFIPIVEKHSISGLAYINSEDSVFDDPLAIAILIDVFTERGFTAVVDIRRMEVPSRIDPKSYEIINRVKKVYRVRINFPAQKSAWLILFYNFMDPRYKALANNLVTHSTNIQPGEKVLLHSFDIRENDTCPYSGRSRKKCNSICTGSVCTA